MRQAGNIWRDNASDVLQQHCTGVTPLDDPTLAGVPRATICPSTNVPIDTSIDLSTIYVQDLELVE